jgi:uncharacterized protein
LLALALITAMPVLADVAVPPLTGRVVDLTGSLGRTQIDEISVRLRQLEDSKGSQIAVLMLPSVKPETIEQYSMRVAEAWKIGRRKTDDGVLVVIAKNDHRMRIEVGRGLEGAIPDITAGRVIDEDFTPSFKKNDYATGITHGIDRLIRLIEGEPLPPPTKLGTPDAGTASSASDAGMLLIIFVVASVVIGALLNGLIGHLPGSLTTAAGVGLLTGLLAGAAMGVVATIAAFVLALMSTFILQAIAEGSLSSGGSWSSSGGGSSDSGSFSGGGGDFAGGGASGDW